MRTQKLCTKITNRLCAYTDGGLSAAERARMEAHLADCAACRAELASQQKADAALTTARFDLPASGDLIPKFYARLSAQNTARSPRRFHSLLIQWRLAVPALAAATLFAALWRPGLDVPLPTQETAPHQKAAQAAPTKSAQRGIIATAATPRAKHLFAPRSEATGETGRMPANTEMRLADASPVAQRDTPKIPPAPLTHGLASNVNLAKRNEAAAWSLKLGRAEDAAQFDSTQREKLASAALGFKAGRVTETPQRVAMNGLTYDTLSSSAVSGDGVTTETRNDAVLLRAAALAYGLTAQDSLSVAGGAQALGVPSVSAPPQPTALAKTAPTSNLPASFFAMDAPPISGEALATVARAETETPATDDVDFEVKDEVRGFESRARLTARVEQEQGQDGETLTINAEADNGT